MILICLPAHVHTLFLIIALCFRKSVCYHTAFTSNGLCTATRIPGSEKDIVEHERVMQIASPNFYVRGGTYQAHSLCQYHVPQCADRDFLNLKWETGEFDLESPLEFYGLKFCLDQVHILGHTLDTKHLVVDQQGLFCGMQPGSLTRITSRPLKITFQSNDKGQFGGFLLTFECKSSSPPVEPKPDIIGTHDEQTPDNCITVGLPALTPDPIAVSFNIQQILFQIELVSEL